MRAGRGLFALVVCAAMWACGDEDDGGSRPAPSVSAAVSPPTTEQGSTAALTTAELEVEPSAEGDELTVRYSGRLADERWLFMPVYRVQGDGPRVQVGTLILDGEVGLFEPYTGSAPVAPEGVTHGPGPETYPSTELDPGDYEVCTELVSTGEEVCAAFSELN